jgi:hypothetical protein
MAGGTVMPVPEFDQAKQGTIPMRLSNKTVFILAICLFSTGAVAEKIYRSVDKQGEVTFSDEPPPTAVDVEQVEVQPAPTEAEHRESVERVKRMESQANEMGEARAERTPPQPEQLPEEVQPTQTIQNYDDGVDSYRRDPRREVIRPGGERPAHVPARRPAAHPGGGGGGRAR